MGNPFSGCGGIVFGDSFIGRKNLLKVIENKLFGSQDGGNLAIVGEPRTGKSSLVYHGIIQKRKELVGKKILPIWINVARFESKEEFFQNLVNETFSFLDSDNLTSPPVIKAFERIQGKKVPWVEAGGLIQRFFSRVRNEGLRTIIVLDEFDHSRNLFKKDISGFQFLRELAYHPEWRVSLVTTSRRAIKEIEEDSEAISTLAGIFETRYLGLFDEDDLSEFFNLSSSHGLDDIKKAQNEILKLCGAHPFFLTLFGEKAYGRKEGTSSFSVGDLFEEILPTLLEVYSHTIRLLGHEKRLDKFLQILTGLITSATKLDLDHFLRVGLLKEKSFPGAEKRYFPFSEHFGEFCKIASRNVDLWPLWSKTERSLRDLVVQIFKKAFGVDWLDKVEKKLSPDKSGKTLFEKCREAMSRESKSFGQHASSNLLDFTYPGDLFGLIEKYWNEFKDVFGKDKNYWHLRFEALSRIRNPIAHNRFEPLPDFEKMAMEAYSKELLNKIDDFLRGEI